MKSFHHNYCNKHAKPGAFASGGPPGGLSEGPCAGSAKGRRPLDPQLEGMGAVEHDARQGTVIFIVLVFILAVTTLVVISSTSLQSEIDFVENEFNRLRAYTRCLSGMEFLKNRLLTYSRDQVEFKEMMGGPCYPRLFLDGYPTPVMLRDLLVESKYRRPFRRNMPADLEFEVSLQDSAGLLNVFKLDPMLLKNLLENHGISGDRVDVLLPSLRDWMDSDDFIRPGGAETPFYMKNYGYPAANRLIDSPEQLLMVNGFDKDIYNAIGHLLDFNIENRGINPNTMPYEAFFVFRGLSEANIRSIMENRREKPYTGHAELTLLGGYNFSAHPNLYQFFTSNTTYVKIKSKMDEERNYYISFRLDQLMGGGAMRSGGPDRFGPGAAGVRSTENFNRYYGVFYFREGTERNDYDQQYRYR